MNTRGMMFDYSELLLNIQKTHRECHDAMRKRDWEKGAYLAFIMQVQAAALANVCNAREKNEPV